MSDLSYTASEASQALSKSNDAATNSQEQMKKALDEISSALGANGTAVGGQLGNMMEGSATSDLNQVITAFQNKLDGVIASTQQTNVEMENLADETQSLYK